MTTALIYTRVSEDRSGGRSVDEQEAESRALCDREGWSVTEVVSDRDAGASRHSKGHRDGWDLVRRQLEDGGIDVLVTWEASRAQRDLGAYVELRELCERHNVRWSYNGRTFDLGDSTDRFTTGIDALVSEREADETSKRVRRAMRASAAKGRPPGRRLFGYSRVYDLETGGLLGQEPDADEAPIVRRIFDEYLGGRGIRTIARSLNEEGVATSTGSKWAYTQVARVLRNPAYAARRVYQGEVIGDADWPALVDPAAFDRAQQLRDARRGSRTRQTATARLLTAVGRCGVCGAKVHALHDRRGRKFYQCDEGYHVARDLAKLDAFVGAVIVERLSRPDVAEALAAPSEDPEMVEALAEARILRDRLDAAVAEFAAGRLTVATLAKVEAELLADIATAESRARRAAVPLQVEVDGDIALWWEDLAPEIRREVVGALIVAVAIMPTKQGSRTFNPDDVRIEWRGT